MHLPDAGEQKRDAPNPVRHASCRGRHPRRLPASGSGYVATNKRPPRTTVIPDACRREIHGWMANIVIPSIRLKHSPASGEDQRQLSVSCLRGQFSSRTRRQASRMPARRNRCAEQNGTHLGCSACVVKAVKWHAARLVSTGSTSGIIRSMSDSPRFGWQDDSAADSRSWADWPRCPRCGTRRDTACPDFAVAGVDFALAELDPAADLLSLPRDEADPADSCRSEHGAGCSGVGPPPDALAAGMVWMTNRCRPATRPTLRRLPLRSAAPW